MALRIVAVDLQNEAISKAWLELLDHYACDPMGWRRKCLINIAKAGFFSSDRTIAEYDRDIWHLGK